MHVLLDDDLGRLTVRRVSPWHQYTVLTRRYLELLSSNRKALAILLLQTPIIAAFMSVIFRVP